MHEEASACLFQEDAGNQMRRSQSSRLPGRGASPMRALHLLPVVSFTPIGRIRLGGGGGRDYL